MKLELDTDKEEKELADDDGEDTSKKKTSK
jgi:hypothetical protein